jgi:signal transduction histidine kinase
LDNAIKYTPRGGRVRLSAKRDAGHVEIIMADSGPGIPVEHRARVTERFYRLPAASGTPGSGLGLSLVAAVAERHHSALAIGDAGPGLSVRWRIPAG